jgi:hypothetical protein
MLLTCVVLQRQRAQSRSQWLISMGRLFCSVSYRARRGIAKQAIL